MAKVIAETERLILRELVFEDAERLFLLDSNPLVMQFIGVPVITKIEESEKLIQKILKQYQDYGVGRWAVIEKASGLLIGWSGLKFLVEPINGFNEVYEFGYRFLPEFWGKGFATEAGKAVLDFGFNDLNLNIIYACADIKNEGSNKILGEKFQFTKRGTFVDSLDNATCFWYDLEKGNYL